MKHLVYVFFVVLLFTGCLQKKTANTEPSEQGDVTGVSNDTIELESNKNVDKFVSIIDLPECTIDESLFAAFPKSLEDFKKSNIPAKIADDAESLLWSHGEVFAFGDNFWVSYVPFYENVGSVELSGKSVFEFWNQFFDANRESIVNAWASQAQFYRDTDTTVLAYRSNVDPLGIIFSFGTDDNDADKKVKKINIYHDK